MKVHQDRLGETAQAGCAMRGVRHGALSSAKVKLGPHSGPYRVALFVSVGFTQYHLELTQVLLCW